MDMDIKNTFDNSVWLDEECYDINVQHLTVDSKIRDLWNPEKCLTISFDRGWNIDKLNLFIIHNFPNIKYLQILCSNYMLDTNHIDVYNFKDFPKTITHLHIRCATYQKLIGHISAKYLSETNLEWLMVDGRIIETDYTLPETLKCFIRACKNNDHEKRICLTTIPLNWEMKTMFKYEVNNKGLDFRGDKCGFMEIYNKVN